MTNPHLRPGTVRSFDVPYDYVIVGAGTAGCVLAARLSEDENVRVLLVEAGSDTALPEMAIPGAWPSLIGSSADWGGSTVVQGFSGTAIPAPRGRTIGGSSSTNGLNFVRGHRASYDAWVEQGATGWGYDDLLPYFRRSETTDGRDPLIRGIEGPMTVGPMRDPSPVIVAALAAAAELGFEAAADINSGLETGFGLSDGNITSGARQSAADAYLLPVLDRPNLDVVTDALVRRVLVIGGTATGIEFSHRGESRFVRATRDVVLAAGAIGTPQLLMVSGIGPAEHLRDAGVDVVLDLPGVGTNLHDHPMSTVVYSATADVQFNPGNLYGQGVGLVRTRTDLPGPDLQILLIAQPYRAQTLVGPDNGYAIGFSAITPFSRGTVRLASADPQAPPLIDPNYLGDSRDVDVMAAGLRLARSIGRANALNGWRGDEVQPGGQVALPDDIRAYLQRSLVVYFHYAGTCRVGIDNLAVVDPELRVRGIVGLRVADASIMPSAVSGNTNATVFAIAERAAALIAK